MAAGDGRRHPRGAKPLGEFAETLLTPIAQRQTGMTLDLIAAWEQIAGPEHYAKTAPERLKWPRGTVDEFTPATLVVACEGSHAVFFQHAAGTVVERLNRFFGFAAVDRVQIVQKPVTRTVPARPAPPRPTREGARAVDERVAAIADPGLREALRRLGRGVAADAAVEAAAETSGTRSSAVQATGRNVKAKTSPRG